MNIMKEVDIEIKPAHQMGIWPKENIKYVFTKGDIKHINKLKRDEIGVHIQSSASSIQKITVIKNGVKKIFDVRKLTEAAHFNHHHTHHPDYGFAYESFHTNNQSMWISCLFEDISFEDILKMVAL